MVQQRSIHDRTRNSEEQSTTQIDRLFDDDACAHQLVPKPQFLPVRLYTVASIYSYRCQPQDLCCAMDTADSSMVLPATGRRFSRRISFLSGLSLFITMELVAQQSSSKPASTQATQAKGGFFCHRQHHNWLYR